MVETFQSWQWGGGARTNALGAPAMPEQTKPGDSLQARVELVVPIIRTVREQQQQ